ncbi:MAG: SMP-30/gluconolactonase/LRE family protein [Bauldia sp.]|nr:SMP-30/gluconolactonase/LRE family protein [Bauldia sp.]
MEITRRTALAGAAAAAVTAAMTSTARAAQWVEELGYPDPRMRVLDSSVSLRVFNSRVEQLATGFWWTEGPVWFGDGRYLLFSDIPKNKIMKWDEATGEISTFRDNANNTNGHARDRQGRLLSCEHLTRRVTRTEYDGRITVLADTYDGKPLNSPNDLAVHPDGSIYFTDPTPGINGWYEGERATAELPTNVYRIDGTTGALTLVADEIRPNGICFSPDYKILYVTDSTLMPRGITAFDVADDGTVSNRRAFIQSQTGGADGIKCDANGNVWCGWSGTDNETGPRCFSPAGVPVLQIDLPERAANICFGGPRRNRLFMAGSQSLYSVFVNVQGAELL